METQKSQLHVWHPWMIVLVIGILLPLFGLTLMARAADSNAVAQPASASLTNLAPAEDPNGRGHGGHDGDDHGGSGIYGVVESKPATGTVGLWMISGTTYTVTEETEVHNDFGSIGVGACVKVQLTEDGSAVRELEGARKYHCGLSNGEPGQAHGVLFGDIITFPEGLIGDWVVGNVTVTTNISTEFSQKNDQFAVGVLVKVEFVVDTDGSFLATEIRAIITPDGGDDDGHHGGHHGGGDHGDHEGKVFATIDSLPDGGLLGVWRIGDISYTVTSHTELNNHKGPFAPGQNVKVEYQIDTNGDRVATEIKSMPNGAGGQGEDFKLVGIVQSMPVSGFVGIWKIAGVELVADANSKFDEEHGMVAVDSFVKVEYVEVNNTLLIRELETHVPPGAGDDNCLGKVEKMGDDNFAAASVSANNVWQIAGRQFTVTPATQVASGLSTGSLAYVNSYTATDGTQVATRISSVTLDNILFLPAAMK